MTVVCWLLSAAYIILVAHVILSWVPRPAAPFVPVVRFVHALVEPVLAPIRRVLPPVALGNVGLDLSVLVVFFALVILQRLVGC